MDINQIEFGVQREALRNAYADVIGCGIECNGGWFRLVGDMVGEMVRHVEAAGFARTDLRITQIKEKYGTLRCYYQAPVDLEQVIDHYELISAHTCETCGRIGRRHGERWVATLCDCCAAAGKRPVTQLSASALKLGAILELEPHDNDEVTVRLKDRGNRDREPFMYRVHRNDIPLAVAALLNDMLVAPQEQGAAAP